MKDFRVEVKIRNNRIFSRVMERWGSISLFSLCTGLTYVTILQYIGFKINPIRKLNKKLKHFSVYKGDLPWKNTAIQIADVLNCSVLDLWPDEYFREIRNNKYFFEADKEDMLNLPYEDRVLLMQGKPALSDFNIENIDNVLKTLTPREEKIIKLRFGLNEGERYTFEAIANIEGISRKRIRQIEAKALRKLRHPSRSRRLLVKHAN